MTLRFAPGSPNANAVKFRVSGRCRIWRASSSNAKPEKSQSFRRDARVFCMFVCLKRSEVVDLGTGNYSGWDAEHHPVPSVWRAVESKPVSYTHLRAHETD